MTDEPVEDDSKKQKKQWKDLSGKQRAGAGLGGLVQFILLAAALWDLRRRPAELVRGPKWLWGMVVFINFVGPVSYFVVGRKPASSAELPVTE